MIDTKFGNFIKGLVVILRSGSTALTSKFSYMASFNNQYSQSLLYFCSAIAHVIVIILPHNQSTYMATGIYIIITTILNAVKEVMSLTALNYRIIGLTRYNLSCASLASSLFLKNHATIVTRIH